MNTAVFLNKGGQAILLTVSCSNCRNLVVVHQKMQCFSCDLGWCGWKEIELLNGREYSPGKTWAAVLVNFHLCRL